MPICSYLVFPQPGQLQRVADQLDALPECMTNPSTGGELLMLLTSTETAEDEKALQEHLHAIEDMQCMVMTFGADAEMVQ